MLVGALALHSKVSALGNEGRPSITGVQGPPAQGAGQLSRERVACRARTVDTQAHVHTHTHTHTNKHTHTHLEVESLSYRNRLFLGAKWRTQLCSARLMQPVTVATAGSCNFQKEGRP